MKFRITTIEEVLQLTDYEAEVFCDTETDGLYGRIELFQVFQEHWDEVLLVRRPDNYQLVSYLSSTHSVWHNAHYDISTLQDQLGGVYLGNLQFDDTFLLSRLTFTREESFSLDDMLTYVLKFDPYAQHRLDKKALQKSKWSNAHLSEDQLLYAALDVWHLPELYNAVKHKREDQNYILDKSIVCKCLHFQHNGMHIDEIKLNTKWTSIEQELSSIDMPINANSWQQVRKWLGVDQSDDKFLAELEIVQGNEKAGRIRKVRKLRKQISFLEKYDLKNGTLKGKFKPSTRSGRLASDCENLQQIPRSLKCIFGYQPDDGRVLIYSDYAQLELRTICAILGVSLMEKLFRDGEDLHGYVAKILFGDDYTKSDRTVTKTYNFNLLYGGSVNMVLSILIGYGLLVEQAQANRHKSKWLNLFPEINKWQQEQIAAWQRGKIASTPFGRQYVGKLMTDQMNIMNQGAGAEVAKLALHYFYPWLLENYPDEVKLSNFIHDSFILDAPDDPVIYEEVSMKLAECMQRAWFEMSKLYKIKDLPMPVDVRVGYNWGDIEEDKFIWSYELEGMTHANS